MGVLSKDCKVRALANSRIRRVDTGAPRILSGIRLFMPLQAAPRDYLLVLLNDLT
jgi:hypothetical protein